MLGTRTSTDVKFIQLVRSINVIKINVNYTSNLVTNINTNKYKYKYK